MLPPPRSPLFPYTTLFRSCGVAFEWQIAFEIPVERHDIVLDCILTPMRWHEVTGRQRSDRKSTRLNSSHTVISYAVFCLKKKTIKDALEAVLRIEPWLEHG